MIKRLLIALLLASSSCLGQLPRVIQSTGNGGGLTCTFRSNVTSGHVLIVMAQSQGSGTTASAADSLGTPTVFSTAQSNTGSTYKDFVFIGTATASGADTITVTWASSAFTSATCSEWDFAGISTTVDATVSNTYPSNSSVTSSNLTTTLNGDLLISGCSTNTPAGPYSTTDKFLAYAGGSVAIGSGYRIAGTNGNYSTSYTFNGAGKTGVIWLIAFKPSSTVIVAPSVLPDAIQSDPYSYTLQAQGGAGAYTWSITGGSLPAGLSLNSGSGLISGTPTNSNGNTITFHVTDGTNTANLNATLHVGTSAATVTHVKDSNTSGVFTGNVTAGNLIIVPVLTSGAGYGIPLCTDTLSTSLTLSFSSINGAGAGNAVSSVKFLAGIASSTGSDTVTCDTSILGAASEFSGVQLFTDSNVISNGSSGGSTSFTTSSLTPLASNALLYAGVSGVTPASYSATSPCTLAAAPSAGGTCWMVSTTQTGYTVNFTSNNNQTGWSLGLESFRPASTGTAPPLSSGYPVIY